jgi:FkbM family methyltransferase
LPHEIRVRVDGVTHPIVLRTRTSDLEVFLAIFANQEYRIDEPRITPSTIVDLGANTGLASIYFSTQYPNARIIAVEPEHSNFELLVRNTRNYPNIEAINMAMWSNDGEVRIATGVGQDPDADKWGYRTVQSGGVAVAGISMRKLMTMKGLSSIDLLKVDIEGAEVELFADPKWMDLVGLLLIEFHDRLRPGCSDAVLPHVQGWRRRPQGDAEIFERPASH